MTITISPRIQQIVDQWPSPTEEQLARIREILRAARATAPPRQGGAAKGRNHATGPK
jgi:hypothetical protein